MKRILYLILLSIMLCGCVSRQLPQQSQPRLVTQITAQYSTGTVLLQRSYTDGDKMRSVLDYFRCLNPYGSVEHLPDTGSQIQVTVHFSDGSSKQYEQYADTYLRQDSGPWQLIDPEKGQELALILGLSESD